MSTAGALLSARPAISPSRSTANGCIGWLAGFGHRCRPRASWWWRMTRFSASGCADGSRVRKGRGEGAQLTVGEAENGRVALKRIQESEPDVILLDLMMPEMDGFAVVAALQKETGWRDIPVIVITARDLDAKDRERLNAGVQFVLVK